MEQVLLAPKTGQSKAIFSRRFALLIASARHCNFKGIGNCSRFGIRKWKYVCRLSYRILKMKKVLRFRHPRDAPDHDMKKPIPSSFSVKRKFWIPGWWFRPLSVIIFEIRKSAQVLAKFWRTSPHHIDKTLFLNMCKCSSKQRKMFLHENCSLLCNN